MSTKDVRLSDTYFRTVDEINKNAGQKQLFDSQSHCVALAGPGSGKTKTLTAKLARIITEDVNRPRGVACLTYNNECARELRKRLAQLGISEDRNTFIGTVHSFCLLNILVPFGRLAGLDIPDPISVAAPKEQKEYLNASLNQIFGSGKKPSPTEIDFHRRTYLDRDSEEWRTNNVAISCVIDIYEQNLRQNGQIDFDDMVLLGLRAIEENLWIRKLLKARFPVLVVDEYQDLGVSLHRIVNCLCFESGIRLIAVGDRDQSIYGFTGARPHLLEELANRNDVETVHLNMNYRCGKTIVHAAELILDKTHGEYQTPDDAVLGTIDYYECPHGLEEQAQKICNELIPKALASKDGRRLGDIAILYIDKNDGDVIADYATQTGFDFIRIDGNAPYSKTPLTRWLEECAAWCSGGWSENKPRLSDIVSTWLNFNRTQFVSNDEKRVLRRKLVGYLWSHRTPNMLLSDWLSTFDNACLKSTFYEGCEQNDAFESLEQLLFACASGGKIENFTVAAFAGQGGSPEHLNLVTLHSAKGLEYEVVIMMGMDQGRIPWTNDGPIKKAEKRRLFFVGVTRAKYEVHMTYSGWYRYNGVKKLGPSEFLSDLRKKMKL